MAQLAPAEALDRHETYDRHAEKLREDLTLARIDRHSGQLEELDGEGTRCACCGLKSKGR